MILSQKFESCLFDYFLSNWSNKISFKTAKKVEKTLYKESDFGLAIFVDFPEGLTHDFE